MPGMYHTCPVCGSSLDPGEACDCQREDPRMSNVPRLAGKVEPQEKGGAGQ